MKTFGLPIKYRLHHLGGTMRWPILMRWPVLLDKFVSDQNLRHPTKAGPLIYELRDAKPMDATGQWALDVVTVATASGDTRTAGAIENIWGELIGSCGRQMSK